MGIADATTDTTSAPLLRESIYDHLRTAILTCHLVPGAKIEAAELAARFHVSKSPVRDALMRLERQNLVITLPRQGYRVTSISLSDVQDMFHLRAAMERACMERIVDRATDEELATLDAYRTFHLAAYPQGFVAYNRAFHERITELGKNVRMRDQLNDLMDQMERAVYLSASNFHEGNPTSLVAEHCGIIDALQSRRLKQAQRLIEKHVRDASKRVHRAISRFAITE